MYRGNNIVFCFVQRIKSPAFILSATWVAGLLAGLYTVSIVPTSYFSLMRSILYDRMSIVVLVLTLIFPFLFSYVAYRLSMPFLIFPIAFLKAFTFAYSAFGVVMAYGDAGWMMRWLLLFSDSFIVVLLLWFWFRNASANRITLNKALLVCVLLASFICLFDYSVILPLSASLVNY